MEKCYFCKEKVIPNEVGVYKQINGWVPIRIQGGSNTVALSSDPLAWAHGNCIDKQRMSAKNKTPQTETLF